MNSFNAQDKKKAIIETTWEYLLKSGMTNASVGDLCREAKLAQSSLYYWFENKDDIWISAGKYGISKVVEALFEFTLNHTNDIREYFTELLNEVEKYKYELRLAMQAVQRRICLPDYDTIHIPAYTPSKKRSFLSHLHHELQTF